MLSQALLTGTRVDTALTDPIMWQETEAATGRQTHKLVKDDRADSCAVAATLPLGAAQSTWCRLASPYAQYTQLCLLLHNIKLPC